MSDGGKRRFTSRGGRLLLLFTCVVVPLGALIAYEAADITRQVEDQVQQRNLIVARGVASGIDDHLAAVGELLAALATSEHVRAMRAEPVAALCAGIVSAHPDYHDLQLLDASGTVVSAVRGTRGERLGDARFYLRARAAGGASVGELGYEGNSRVRVVRVTVPVRTDEGATVGYLTASLVPARVQERVTEAVVPTRTIVAVLDGDGVVIARNVDPEDWVGRGMGDIADFGTMHGRSEGVGKTRTPEGLVRVYAFATTRGIPWYVRVGGDARDVGRAVRDELVGRYDVFAPILLVGVLGWLWLGREVDRLRLRTEHLSLIDPLTELWNCKRLERDFERELSRASRHGQDLSFLMIDADEFRVYNDHNGHEAGDETLRLLADVVRANVRDIDAVYRYGGEEMCALLPLTDRDGAVAVAERVREAVEAAAFEGQACLSRGTLTVSVGVATFPGDAITKNGLIRCADSAMHRAKRLSRNRVEASWSAVSAS